METFGCLPVRRSFEFSPQSTIDLVTAHLFSRRPWRNVPSGVASATTDIVDLSLSFVSPCPQSGSSLPSAGTGQLTCPYPRGSAGRRAPWISRAFCCGQSAALLFNKPLRSNINNRHRTTRIIGNVCSFRIRCDSYPKRLATNGNRRTHDSIGFGVNHIHGIATTSKNWVV